MWLALAAALLAGVLGMDDILARLAVVEGQAMNARQRIEELDASTLQLKRAQEASQNAALLSRLDPGPLTQLAPYAGASAAVPALGQPLMARLQSDASMVGVTAGRIDPTTSFGNLLPDPTFATLPIGDYTLTTVDAYISDATPQWLTWQARYVLNSGTAPATAKTISRSFDRWINGLGYGSLTDQVSSSGWGVLSLSWGAAAGDITVYLTSSDVDPATLSEMVESWLVAGGDVLVPGTYSNVTSATAYVEIISAAGTLQAQSDPVDLLDIKASDLRGRLETALDAPTASEEYRWRLRIDVVYPATAGALDIAFTQPLLAWSDDGSLPQFTPAVGRWVPEAQRYHGARAFRSATQAIGDTTDTAVTFPTGSASESWDTELFHDMSTNTAHFTAPWDGYYQVNAGIGFAGNATGRRDLWIEANGDGVKRALQRELNPTATDCYLTTSLLVRLTAGSYVRMLVWQNSGGNLNVLGNDRTTWLDISLVGV